MDENDNSKADYGKISPFSNIQYLALMANPMC